MRYFAKFDIDGNFQSIFKTSQPVVLNDRYLEITAEEAATNSYVGKRLDFESRTLVDSDSVEPNDISELLALQARAERDARIAKTDWTQGQDIPTEIASKWREYRQSLRDITEQSGFPHEIVWPDKPK